MKTTSATKSCCGVRQDTKYQDSVHLDEPFQCVTKSITQMRSSSMSPRNVFTTLGMLVVLLVVAGSNASAQQSERTVDVFVPSEVGGRMYTLARAIVRELGDGGGNVIAGPYEDIGRWLSKSKTTKSKPLRVTLVSTANAPFLSQFIKDLPPVALIGRMKLVLLTQKGVQLPTSTQHGGGANASVVVGANSAVGELLAHEVLASSKVEIRFESARGLRKKLLSGELTAVVVPKHPQGVDSEFDVFEVASPVFSVAYGVLAPVGSDVTVLKHLAERLKDVLKKKDVQKIFGIIGVVPEYGDGDKFRRGFDTVDTKYCKTCVCKTSKRCRRLCKTKCK